LHVYDLKVPCEEDLILRNNSIHAKNLPRAVWPAKKICGKPEGDFLERSDSYSMRKYEMNLETSVALRQGELEDKPKKG
jgi:hypothetical protein